MTYHPQTPKSSMKVVTRGVRRSQEAALAAEREAFLELVQTEACHNLVELFFLEARAKRPDLAGVPPTRGWHERPERKVA